MENPIKMDDLEGKPTIFRKHPHLGGYPYCWKHPCGWLAQKQLRTWSSKPWTCGTGHLTGFDDGVRMEDSANGSMAAHPLYRTWKYVFSKWAAFFFFNERNMKERGTGKRARKRNTWKFSWLRKRHLMGISSWGKVHLNGNGACRPCGNLWKRGNLCFTHSCMDPWAWGYPLPTSIGNSPFTDSAACEFKLNPAAIFDDVWCISFCKFGGCGSSFPNSLGGSSLKIWFPPDSPLTFFHTWIRNVRYWYEPPRPRRLNHTAALMFRSRQRPWRRFKSKSHAHSIHVWYVYLHLP